MRLGLINLLAPGQPVSAPWQHQAGEAVTCASMGTAGHRLPSGAGTLLRSCLCWGVARQHPTG